MTGVYPTLCRWQGWRRGLMFEFARHEDAARYVGTGFPARAVVHVGGGRVRLVRPSEARDVMTEAWAWKYRETAPRPGGWPGQVVDLLGPFPVPGDWFVGDE